MAMSSMNIYSLSYQIGMHKIMKIYLRLDVKEVSTNLLKIHQIL